MNPKLPETLCEAELCVKSNTLLTGEKKAGGFYIFLSVCWLHQRSTEFSSHGRM